MASKTVDQLSTLSGISDTDYFVVYDGSESGNEKLKKYPYTTLVSDGSSDFMLRDGSTSFTSTVVGVTPTDLEHLSTKGYVDEEITSLSAEMTALSGVVYSSGGIASTLLYG